ncbi:MAG: hypothetical protein O3A82_03075 [Verrucomicrobia bacterium]|nr:hypothetical protein [Verrucomicrobiota bacterium]
MLKTFDLCILLSIVTMRMQLNFNRRRFLRGAGVLIALPALESIGFRRFASAATQASVAIPKRADSPLGQGSQTWAQLAR